MQIAVVSWFSAFELVEIPIVARDGGCYLRGPWLYFSTVRRDYCNGARGTRRTNNPIGFRRLCAPECIKVPVFVGTLGHRHISPAA